MDQLSREDIVAGLSDVVGILARSHRPAGVGHPLRWDESERLGAAQGRLG